MANYDTAAWAELKLVQRLRSIDENMWYDISQQINKIAPLLSWRPIGLEEYTDHDINHCYRVLKALGNIIPDTFILTKHELEILIYAVVFHDIGMWTKKGEVEKSLSDEQFQSFFKKQNSYKRIKGLIDSSAAVDSNLGYLLLRQVVANYHRSHHPERSAIILNNMEQDLYLDSRISEEKLGIIANICAAHGWELDEVLVSDLLGQFRLNVDNEFLDESEIIVDVRLLAFFLRIGDLLDLDAKRISSIVRAYLEPLSPESEAHWQKHKWLYFQRLNPEVIEIRGNFNYDKHGSIAVDAYNLAKSWCGYLNDDITTLKKALLAPSRYDMKEGRMLGTLLLDVSGIKAEGIVFSDKLSFNMDKERIMEILGDEIYDDKSAFIRELIQNAIDATRTKLVDDYQNGQYPNYYNLDPRTPNAWPREITSGDKYSIHIKTGNSILNIGGNNENLLYFEIKDNGIGMSIKQIKDYFLQIGKSYYRSREFLTNYKHSSISRFGIGFLTCLIVAKKIVLFTKSQKEGEGIRLDMDSESNLISAVKDDSIDFFGTKVIVYFKSELTEDEEWLPGIPQRIDKDKLYSILHSEMLHATKLEQAVSYWIPWCEFKISVNNRERMPKSPIDLTNNQSYWSVPFYVQSVENMEKLATGVFVTPKTHCIQTMDYHYRTDHAFLPSIGGVAIPPWEEERTYLTYID